MKIGFVGLGIMGQPMALNLVKSGFDVIVWNRTSGKAGKLTAEGATEADSLQQVAEIAETIIIMVNDTPDVEAVIFGKSGLEKGLLAGKTVIDMTTINPDATEDFAIRLKKIGCEMLDAPVSGGDIGAQKGTLTIMVGGERAVFETCLPIFEALGENVVHCGGHGNGQRTKMINQIFCGLHAVALSEAFVLAEKMGLNLETVHQVVSSGAAGSWALDNYGPRVLQVDFNPGFKLGMQQKDLRIAAEI
ncbi:NAD(P)-dependent oxidoreductase, partial [candidate division KSB1 bacterium]|nr:NAD(P)-dependent oxidoreductase [candidate division KSB1 bacterium]NIR70179.1 NAD(P)-dependent oxidoreductase [candidate division KSB1 bacterium]NIS27565.1 NAD(P)-dependent oxidoreductase [candidate division KSB1 bacterium]NIT74418.1 NAD(P)-dependent oxidoreductase [candidate division KSB1 bacterium]NIU28283.1 NAD(P)-dependent oxidoreductase [candidate division KSB1 bacterium]